MSFNITNSFTLYKKQRRDNYLSADTSFCFTEALKWAFLHKEQETKISLKNVHFR